MARWVLILAAVVTLAASASCSRSSLPADSDKGLLVTADGSAAIAWEPLVILTVNGKASDKDAAYAELGRVRTALTAAVQRAVPDASISVSEGVRYKFFESVGTATQKVTIAPGSVDTTERALRAVLKATAQRSCCGWLLLVRPKIGSSALQEARRDALRSARQEAADLARAAGVTAGKVIAITEGPSTPPGPQSLAGQSFTESGLQLMLQSLRARPATSEQGLVSLEVRFAIA